MQTVVLVLLFFVAFNAKANGKTGDSRDELESHLVALEDDVEKLSRTLIGLSDHESTQEDSKPNVNETYGDTQDDIEKRGVVKHKVREGDVTKLTCPGSSDVIRVTYAWYGFYPKYTIFNTKCGRNGDKYAETAKGKLNKICDQKHSCEFTVGSPLFADTCHGTKKFLKMVFTCKLPVATSGVYEDNLMKLECTGSKLITINSAWYGPDNDGPKSKTCVKHAGYYASEAKIVVQQLCENKKGCESKVSNTMLMETCDYRRKILKVDYSCKVPEQETSVSEYAKLANEGDLMKVVCTGNNVITITSAWYGKRIRSIFSKCIKKARNYAGTAKGKVQQLCNEKSACEFKVGPQFADTCHGKQKYLQVAYFCKSRARDSQSDQEDTQQSGGEIELTENSMPDLNDSYDEDELATHIKELKDSVDKLSKTLKDLPDHESTQEDSKPNVNET